MRPTRDTLLGVAAEECGVPGGGPMVALRGQGSCLGGSEGPVCGRLPPQGRLSEPVADGMAWG
jgi:hypothetical protein